MKKVLVQKIDELTDLQLSYLQKELFLEVTDTAPINESPYFIFDDQLRLFVDNLDHIKPLTLDFLSEKFKSIIKTGIKNKNPLFKALGISSKKSVFVLDAMAGLGKDGILMAAGGAKVLSWEVSEWVYPLLLDARRRLIEGKTSILKRNDLWELKQGDSFEFYKKNSDQIKKFDVVYLDPMYPQKKKTALSQSGMQFLQQVGYNCPSRALEYAQWVRSRNVKLVVKRPRQAEPIIEPTSRFVESKMVRYDIYDPKIL